MTTIPQSALLICRMSPRVNGRARALVEALEEEYLVTAVCERPERMALPKVFRKAALLEYRLLFGGRGLLHFGGALRVLQLTLLGLIQIARSRPQVVICADVPYCLAGLLARWIWGCRFVFDAYEIIWGLGEGRLFSAVFKYLERVVLLHCDAWMVPSDLRARIMLREHGLQLDYTVVPNLPTLGEARTTEMRAALQHAGVPASGVTLLFQGTLIPRRGLPELLLAAHGGSFHLVVQGDGPLRSLVAENTGSHVTLLPPCPNEEAVSWLSAVSASFVYYENDCINSAHACSSKFNTSLIAGTPVICNDLPVFREFAKTQGACVILDRLDAPGIVAGVARLADDQAGCLRDQAACAGEALRRFPRALVLRTAVREALTGRPMAVLARTL